MHSQISIEYIAIVGLILFLTIPLLYYSTQRSNEDIRSSEIDTAINSIKSTADKVYSLGLGTKDYTWVKLPTGIQSFQVGLGELTDETDQAGVGVNEILFKMSIFGGLTDISKTTIAPRICKKSLTTLPTSSGNYKIVIEYVNRNEQPDGLCHIEISCGAGQC